MNTYLVPNLRTSSHFACTNIVCYYLLLEARGNIGQVLKHKAQWGGRGKHRGMGMKGGRGCYNEVDRGRLKHRAVNQGRGEWTHIADS